MEQPKVLIIGQPFDKNTGGGITLSNLFQGWEKDKLAVACTGYLFSANIDVSICDNYYRLGDEEFKLLFPFNYIKRKYNSGALKLKKQEVVNLEIQRSPLKENLLDNYYFPFLEYSGLEHIIKRVKLTDKFLLWVKEFNPDVIYFQPSSRANLKFCDLVSKNFKVPVILHMMDDWPSSAADRGFFNKYWQKTIDAELKELIGHCSVLMSISQSMATEYYRRYGEKFIVFHNPINIPFWSRFQKINYSLPESPTFLYAGRTGLGIQTSLETIAKAIECINSKSSMSIKLVLSTDEDQPWARNYSCVELRSYTSYDLVPKTFSEADFLVLPYDFSAKSIKFIKYSMPTKCPEYMISGTPILLFAPPETEIVRYCQLNLCAKIVTENDEKKIIEAIESLLNNKTERELIAGNAKRAAKEHHDAIIVTEAFRNVINSLLVDSTL